MLMLSNHWRSSIPFVVGGPLAHGQAFHLRIWSINWSDGFAQLPELVAFYLLSTEASEAEKRFQGEPMVRLQASSQHPGSIWWVASRLWQDNYLLLVIERDMRSLNGRTLPVNTIGFSSCHQIAGWVYAVYGCPCVAEKMVACFRGMPTLDGPGGLMLTYADYPLYFPSPEKNPQWRPYSKRTMSSLRTPFVHSPVSTNSWEFRKSSPCRPFDVLPNVNATNSWTIFSPNLGNMSG